MSILNLIALFCAYFSLFSHENVEVKKSVEFQKIVISAEFVSEGVCVGDINKDGNKDIIAGAFWYEAPTWVKHQFSAEIRYDKSLKPFPETHVFKVDEGYSDSFANFSADINQDGWVDVIKIGLPGEAVYWFENNQNKSGHWKRHFLCASLGNEAPLFEDVDGDGKKDLIGNDSKNQKVVWYQAPSSKDSVWVARTISANPKLGTHKYTHGLGFADLNQDGRKDVIIKEGWFEMPKDLQTEWTFHALSTKFDCAQMYVYDFDKDGDMDILSSSAHDYGIWWNETKSLVTGEIENHLIDKSLSQTHSMQFVDLNGDKNPDFIVGKRFMAHNGKDPGEFESANLQWFEFQPKPSPHWVSHVIDSDSGAGINFFVEDMNKDKKNDIIISNKKGVFLFKRI